MGLKTLNGHGSMGVVSQHLSLESCMILVLSGLGKRGHWFIIFGDRWNYWAWENPNAQSTGPTSFKFGYDATGM